MGKTINALVALVALAAVFFHATEAEYEHELTWAIPSGGAPEYASWAAAHPFVLNGGSDYDSLTFDFKSGEQDLAEVTKEDFDSCTTTHPIEKYTEAVNLAPGSPGTYYFTCTFAGHCKKGQKIAVTWTNTSAVPAAVLAPAPSPTSSAITFSSLPFKFTSKN